MFVDELRELLNDLPGNLFIVFEARSVGEYEEDDEIETYNIEQIEVYDQLLVFASIDEVD